uniref:Uncharacterized protein n=1 Tax=Moniliophthora roreri TaxID=221103 RepID=A0A0W0GCZ8_MONRR
MAPTHSFSPSVWLFRHLKVKFHGSRYDEYRCDPAVEYGIGEAPRRRLRQQCRTTFNIRLIVNLLAMLLE